MNNTKSVKNRTNCFRKKIQKSHENLPGDVVLAGEVLLKRLEAGFGVEIGEGDRHAALWGGTRQNPAISGSTNQRKAHVSREYAVSVVGLT